MSTEDELRRCREILAELHARHSELMVQLRLQTEAAQHSQRETLRLSRLLREAEHDVSRLRECRDTWKRQTETVVGRNGALTTALAYIAGRGCDKCSHLAAAWLAKGEEGQSS